MKATTFCLWMLAALLATAFAAFGAVGGGAGVIISPGSGGGSNIVAAATNAIPFLNGAGTNTTLYGVNIVSGNGIGLTNLNNVFTNQSKTWYVDANGFSDAKKGNPGHPCSNFMQVATNVAYGDIIRVGPGLFYADEFEVPGVSVIGSGRGITRFTNSTPLTTVCFYICDSNIFANFTINAGVANPFNFGENPTFSPPYTGGGLENVEVIGQGDAIQGFTGRWIDGYTRNCTFTGNWDLLRFGAGSRVEITDCDFNVIGGSPGVSPILRGLYLINTSTGMVSRCNFTFTGRMPTNNPASGYTNFAVTMDYGTISSIAVRDLTTNGVDMTWFYFSSNTVVAGAFAPASEVSGNPVLVGGFSGVNLVTDSVNSNKLDAPTRALFGAGGATNAIANTNGAGTNITFYGTTTFAGGTDTNITVSVSGGGIFAVSNDVTSVTLKLLPTGQTVASSFLIPTNSAASHLVPIGESDFSTNAAFTITGISGILDTAYSYGVLHVKNTGSTFAITPPGNWNSTNGTWFCTNETVISVCVIPGRSTNGICYPQH